MVSFAEGWLLGFSIAAPVGPIGILCIRKTLSQGRAYGFVSGLGAAAADAVYGCIAALGLTLITNYLLSQSEWLKWVGGLFLCYLAIGMFRAKPGTSENPGKLSSAGLIRTFATTFVLTITNPMTIVSFLAVFTGMNASGDTGASALLVTGVFLGSASWWFILSLIVGSLKSMVSGTVMRGINFASGVILLGFGIYIALT